MAISFGTCELCGERTSKAAMPAHLAACAPGHDRARGTPREIFPFRVEGGGDPTYWLDVEVKGSSAIRRLDDLLRRVWLECCGHLSSFWIGDLEYCVLVDHEYGFDPGQRSMNATVSAVVNSPGQRIVYRYDYGSTTELALRFAGARTGIIGRAATRLLARNEPPAWSCLACGAPATLICPFCLYLGQTFVCARHVDAHDCKNGGDSFLPVVNSPRMGVCGYTAAFVRNALSRTATPATTRRRSSSARRRSR